MRITCVLSHFSRVWLCASLWTLCSPPGSSVHRILQARILEWVVMPSSRGSSQPQGSNRQSFMSPALVSGFFTTSTTWKAPGDWTRISCIAGRFFTAWATREATAAAKSLQACPTLCNPIDGSLRGSSVPGILQVRALKWVAISFSNAWKWKVKVKLLSLARLFATAWTAADQAPPSMGSSRQEYWSGLPLLSLINVYRNGLFYFIAVWYSVIMNTPQFRYPFCGWCTFAFLFPLLANIMNNNAVNILVHIVWWPYAHIFGVHSVYMFNFTWFFQSIFQSCTYLSYHQQWVSVLLIHILPNTKYCQSFCCASGCTAESYWICMSLRNIDILLEKQTIFGHTLKSNDIWKK